MNPSEITDSIEGWCATGLGFGGVFSRRGGRGHTEGARRQDVSQFCHPGCLLHPRSPRNQHLHETHQRYSNFIPFFYLETKELNHQIEKQTNN